MIPLLQSNSSTDHASISSDGILEAWTFLNITRAFAIANSSKSANVALGTISADQSLASNIGSSRIASSLSWVISTNESSTRCHAFLWAYTGRRGKCLGIWITQTVFCVSSVIYSLILKPSDERFVQCSINFQTADWAFRLNFVRSVPTISKVLSCTPITRCPPSILAMADTYEITSFFSSPAKEFFKFFISFHSQQAFSCGNSRSKYCWSSFEIIILF